MTNTIRTDFSDYKFRCHALGNLMVGLSKFGLTANQEAELKKLQFKLDTFKPLTPNQTVKMGELVAKRDAKPKLSKTAESYLKKVHKEEIFNRRYDIKSKYLDKGIQAEESGISLYSHYTNTLFLKNKERFENEYFTGEPDNAQGKIRDIKNSWDFMSFPIHEMTPPDKNNYWQVLGYMDLTGLTEAEVIYCLVDTPETLIIDEKFRTARELGVMDLPDELAMEIEKNLKYSDIPEELRIKIFKYQRSEDDVKALYSMVELARVYLNELSLNIADRLVK